MARKDREQSRGRFKRLKGYLFAGLTANGGGWLVFSAANIYVPQVTIWGQTLMSSMTAHALAFFLHRYLVFNRNDRRRGSFYRYGFVVLLSYLLVNLLLSLLIYDARVAAPLAYLIVVGGVSPLVFVVQDQWVNASNSSAKKELVDAHL